uniref:Uncharacterized protein n=1 Tax=Arundo donax TaxID=35708 RepID=A0A0A9DSW7_ARUDO
MFIGKAEGC